MPTADGAAARRPVSTGTPLLRVTGLTVRRGDTAILRDLSWTVRPGEHWVVLGPNGSGKSSLLAALAGYLTPTAGTVELLGRTYGRAHWGELRRRLGLVGAGLPRLQEPDTTARETVLSGRDASLNPWRPAPPAARRQAARLLRAAGLTAVADRTWEQLSEGERQRAFLARALMAQPDLLILDEPCAGLDPVARESLLATLDRLARRPGGPALVLVTHHVEEIESVFTHVLLLRAGRVVAAGSLAQTLTATNLRRCFGPRVSLRCRGGRYGLEVAVTTGGNSFT
jgi:iron complex transport system ATP-binding protein